MLRVFTAMCAHIRDGEVLLLLLLLLPPLAAAAAAL